MENFADISQAVFRDYVRSAVIIDDEWPEYEILISDNQADESESIAEAEEGEELDTVAAALSDKAARPPEAPSVEQLDAEILGRLRHALLREGVLTCGLRYQRKDRGTAIELARRADIVVLDWHLVGADGAEALEILKELLGDSLRFVCIWTGRGRAAEVKEQLIESLSSATSQHKLTLTGPGDLRVGNLVIAIRIKEGLEDEPGLTVDPECFLGVAVGGLAKSFGGLVQLAMLEMTHRHRAHLPEILDHIGSSMDTAVLLEAGDRDSPVGPRGALLSVLVDEWRSRLERDHTQLKSLSKEGRRAFGARLWSARSEDWPNRMKDHLVLLGTKSNVAKRCSEAASLGVDLWVEGGCEGEFPEVQGVSRKIAAWAALYSAMENDTPLDPLLRLDALFHQQLNPATLLTQGTVVRVADGRAEHLLVCTTPLCDADQPTKIGRLFTFVQTRIVPTENILRRGGAEWYCVVEHGDEHLCLEVLVKERVSLEVWDRNFDDNGIVRAHFSLGGGQEQEPPKGDGVELHRVAQLRFEHALALSAASATDAARVGVNRVELIRSRIRRGG